MNWIQNISLTLKTWVFKKKLLKFSDRFRVDPQACFYCPEMCRFSCPTAETLRTNTVTPRGKMSLLHLAERGYSHEKTTGSEIERMWFLEQCTGCGRCTEYCLYEVDVASNLRAERSVYFTQRLENQNKPDGNSTYLRGGLKGVVLLCELGRQSWWERHPLMLAAMGVSTVCEVVLPHREWDWGKLSDAQCAPIARTFLDCTQLWVESPEVAWFLAKGLKKDVKLVWQKFFSDFTLLEFSPGVIFHESFHMSRLFPRLGYSIPMYERGFMPFHHGWNVWDCGGEGFYKLAHAMTAHKMGHRFIHDLQKDGRKVKKIVCQSAACLEHLKDITEIPVVYWLDEL